MNAEQLSHWIFLAGLGQLALGLASFAIPYVLDWRTDTAKLRPLTRQVFWTYAGYIWAKNMAFGLVSTLAPSALLDRSTLAACLCGFITVYWGSRILIQFLVFDRHDTPSGLHIRLAEVALVSLFIALTLIYGAALVWNLRLVGL